MHFYTQKKGMDMIKLCLRVQDCLKGVKIMPLVFWLCTDITFSFFRVVQTDANVPGDIALKCGGGEVLQCAEPHQDQAAL